MDIPQPPAHPAQEKLIQAAQTLYWEQGVTATTPRQILAESGVGQGSLYHHYPTKHDLAYAALTDTTHTMLSQARQILTGDAPAAQRLQHYLTQPLDALKGCPLGRLVSDPTVMAQQDLHETLHTYFTGLLDLVTLVLWEQGLPEPTAKDRAFALVAVLQGGFIIARALGDEKAYDRALAGFTALLTTRP